MSNNNKSSSSDISFMGLLFITFLVLKLCKVIDWSWWWVTSPLWIGLAFGVCVLAFFVLFSALPDPKPKKNVSPTKSKWQQRYDEMIETQEKLKQIKNK